MTSTAARTALARPTLATDLDGTFAHGPPGIRAHLVAALAAAGDGCLLYVTGRSVAAWRELATTLDLPAPAVAITDVGTEVVDGSTGAPLDAFEEDFAQEWPGTAAVRARLAGLPGLDEQPLEARRRVSYTFAPGADRDAVLAAAAVRLAGLPVDLLPSAASYLDILPRGVNKGTTLLRALDHLGRPRETVVVAGDTLNDAPLFATGLRGVVVGNAEPALKARLAGLRHVHFATAEGVAGVAEGLAHFGLVPGEPA